MEYAICTVPAAPVRKEASSRSELTNQLLFGETMQVLEMKDEWYRIKSVDDDYEGWLTWHLISGVDREIALGKHTYISSGLVNSVLFKDQRMNVPMGSVLVGFDEDSKLLWNKDFRYDGAFRNTSLPGKDLLLDTAYEWLNAPYLWGGKTFMGVDCSGFMQTVFRTQGIKLLRDAYQQAEQGELVSSLSQARKNDLAFFNNERGKVTHVGLLISPGQIIHSSGKVRIDKIDEEGIVNSDNGKRTHQLHSIRRLNVLHMEG